MVEMMEKFRNEQSLAAIDDTTYAIMESMEEFTISMLTSNSSD